MKNILVVDDEESVRIVLKQMLEVGGYSVDAAANGEEALSILEKKTCDLMISDINMPQMDGVALLQKTKEKFPKVPVVFITAYGKDKVIMQAMKMGLADYIEKPFRMNDVLDTIKKYT